MVVDEATSPCDCRSAWTRSLVHYAHYYFAVAKWNGDWRGIGFQPVIAVTAGWKPIPRKFDLQLRRAAKFTSPFDFDGPRRLRADLLFKFA